MSSGKEMIEQLHGEDGMAKQAMILTLYPLCRVHLFIPVNNGHFAYNSGTLFMISLISVSRYSGI